MKTPIINPIDTNKHIYDALFQSFYLFGIEPTDLDISEFTHDRKFLQKDLKRAKLLTQFPPYKQTHSYIEPDIIMSHCFPKGYKLLELEKWPLDEYFYFSLDNLYKFSPENKKIYFTAVVIFEQAKSYLEIKHKNKIPPMPKPANDKEKENPLTLEHIFVQKALCFSTFIPFPYETKCLLGELLEYYRTNQIIIPIEKIIEGIIFGIPRPVRAYFYISCKKTNEFIPKQKKDIDFILREFNQYNFYSYEFQSIFLFPPTEILLIYKSLLLEIPILFFGGKKETLSNVIETFMSLLSPLEYQNPYVSILPDSLCGLIETEKSFVFGLNHRLAFSKEKQRIPTFFINNHLNVENKLILICNIDNGKVYQYINSISDYHVVNFDDLGIYPENPGNAVDTTQLISKNIYEGKIIKVKEIDFPEKLVNKFNKELKNFASNDKNKKIQSEEYNPEYNKKIGEDLFYTFLATLLQNYHNYLYNDEENIKRIICNEILNKKEEDIDIEKLFLVNQFLHDNNTDRDFFSIFLKTRHFKNFIIRKYLNLDRYTFLHFDEKIIEKKPRGLFSKKVKLDFSSSKIFKPSHIYQIKNANNFVESEITYMKSHKDVLLNKYFQNFGQYNKIKYTIFPRLIYDNQFLGNKEYRPITEFSNDYKGCLNGYLPIENVLKNEANPHNFFTLYTKEPMTRYIVDINKLDVKNEPLNSLNKVWVYIFCLTFYYCDEIEKSFRFEELMRFLPKVVDEKREIIPLLLMTVKQYGSENMLIKIFESIKNINYSEYSHFCSKFKGNSQIKWESRNIDTTNQKLKISYFRDITNKENALITEIKDEDYDINSLKKRTFGLKNNLNNKEKLNFDFNYKCPSCGQPHETTNLAINLSNKMKSDLMICEKCKKFMEPKTFVTNGTEKIEFIIYSPIKLLSIVREITMEYGQKINLDELRTKYNSFYWNCILYFYLTGLSFEMLLKYKEKENANINKDIKKGKKKRKKFKKLKIERQKTDI